MFANPEVQSFIDRMIGGQTPRSAAPPPSPSYRGALARALLGDVTKPSIGGNFSAPPILAGGGVKPPDPSQGVNRGLGSQELTPLGGSSGGRGGGSGIGAGLGQLGKGIESALKAIAEKRAQQQTYADALAAAPPRPAPFGSPPRPAPFGSTPGAAAANASPAFSSIGAASDTPIFAQPDEGKGPINPAIGAGGSLPLFAAPSSTGGANTAGMTPNQVQAYNFFIGKGWSPEFSLGMVASLTGESTPSLNTAPRQGNDGVHGGGNGIANWSADRWAALGRPQGLDAQLNAVYDEVSQNYPRIAALSSSNLPPSELTNRITGGVDDGGASGTPYPGSYLTPQSANGYNRWDAFTKVSGVNGPPGGQPAVSLDSYAAAAPATGAPPPANVFAGPTLISPGQPQTGPAYSDETWNNRPQYDYGGQQPPPPPPPPLINNGQPGIYPMPGQQGMNDMQQISPLALALMGQGDPTAPPLMSPGIVAMLDSGNLFGFGGS